MKESELVRIMPVCFSRRCGGRFAAPSRRDPGKVASSPDVSRANLEARVGDGGFKGSRPPGFLPRRCGGGVHHHCLRNICSVVLVMERWSCWEFRCILGKPGKPGGPDSYAMSPSRDQQAYAWHTYIMRLLVFFWLLVGVGDGLCPHPYVLPCVMGVQVFPKNWEARGPGPPGMTDDVGTGAVVHTASGWRAPATS